MTITQDKLTNIIEAAILSVGQPIGIDRIIKLFNEEEQPSRDDVRSAIKVLQQDYEQRGMELVEVGSGYRIQAKQDLAPWVTRLWDEKPVRYSRALLETLVLIAYRQPITRGEIENIRGVSVSTNIIKTLQERDWVKIIGHRDVPGKPAIYATTRQFLDYFGLKSLDQLPTLSEIRDLDKISAELEENDIAQQSESENGLEDDTSLPLRQTTELSEKPASEFVENLDGISDIEVSEPVDKPMDQEISSDSHKLPAIEVSEVEISEQLENPSDGGTELLEHQIGDDNDPDNINKFGAENNTISSDVETILADHSSIDSDEYNVVDINPGDTKKTDRVNIGTDDENDSQDISVVES